MQLELFGSNDASLSAQKGNKMKVKTSKKAYAWVVQKRQGGRWRNVVDSGGVITFATRKLARNVSREYNNAAKKPRSYRVRKLA